MLRDWPGCTSTLSSGPWQNRACVVCIGLDVKAQCLGLQSLLPDLSSHKPVASTQQIWGSCCRIWSCHMGYAQPHLMACGKEVALLVGQIESTASTADVFMHAHSTPCFTNSQLSVKYKICVFQFDTLAGLPEFAFPKDKELFFLVHLKIFLVIFSTWNEKRGFFSLKTSEER